MLNREGISNVKTANMQIPRRTHVHRGIFLVVTPLGFKPRTFRTGIWRSIQLSYGTNASAKLLKSERTTKFIWWFSSFVFTSAYPFDYGVLCLSVGNGKDKACTRSVLPVNINAASHFLCNGTTDIETESRTLFESIKFFKRSKIFSYYLPPNLSSL